MSNRKKCTSILDSFSEGQLVNIAAMSEAARTAIDEAADDAFCARLHAQYESKSTDPSHRAGTAGGQFLRR